MRRVAAVAIVATGLAVAVWLWDGAEPERAPSSRTTAEWSRPPIRDRTPPERGRRAGGDSSPTPDREPVPVETRAERNALPVPPLYEDALLEAGKWLELRREAQQNDDEKAEALEAWSARLAEIVTGGSGCE